MPYKVGSVPYVNAKPLVWKFEHLGSRSPVQVIYEVPSKLPGLLRQRAAEAVLVSSFEAIAEPQRKIVSHVCIGSDGPVESVRLFSKVPPDRIGRLALDASSLTSNRLAQIILAERHGATPETIVMAPDLSSMLSNADACVLIGDIGMETIGTGLTVLDLGHEWSHLTGLPFVWALWVGNNDVPPELADELSAALSFVREPAHWMAMIADTAIQSRWSESTCRRYLESTIQFDLNKAYQSGLTEFGRRLVSNGILKSARELEIVGQPISTDL